MESQEAETPKDAVVLDAAAPLLEPRTLARRLPAVKKGGVDALLATAGAIEDFRATMESVGHWLEIERAGKHGIRIARSVADIRTAKVLGQTAVVIHFQGSDPIEDELDFLNAFHAAGLRVMQLTYNTRNRIGDGCFEPGDAGLSRFGKSVIRRMEELSIVVDLAHAAPRTAMDAIATAARPLIISHANARALCDTPRNFSDEIIRAVAASGGVIGLCAAPFFVSRQPKPTLDDLLRHADHISELVGPEHLGLGLDFAEEDEEDYVYFGYDERYIPHPPWIWPASISGHAEVPNIGEALRARHYAQAEIRGILGENFLRVFQHVWGG